MAFVGWLVLSSANAPGPGEPGYAAVDPHGYMQIFGTFVLLCCAPVLLSLVIGLTVLVSKRRRAGR